MMMSSIRRLSIRGLTVGDFSAAHVVPRHTGKALVAAASYPSSTELFRFTGKLSRVNTGVHSLQVGRDAHLIPSFDQPWVYLDHSFTPTVQLLHDPVVDAIAPIITAKATVDLEPGAPLTIDYTLHEWEMTGDGFVCGETGRRVRGFKHLTPGEREAVQTRAPGYLREMLAEAKVGMEAEEFQDLPGQHGQSCL